MSDFAEEFASLQETLASVVERLDDLAVHALRLAIERGETKRPGEERQITRARNAVIRAIGLLRIDDVDQGE